ncbi:MAG: thioesterase family protein [Calditrichae bacterium]|nr:thioesterase family protein [Calditrichia bacterium]
MNLYIRFIKLIFKIIFAKKRSPLEKSILTFRVWPLDCDIYLHLTNARYPAFMDLGRTLLLGQAGIIGKLLKNKYLLIPVSSEISFIREIKPFQKFELHSELITWDDTYWFVDQKFISGETLHAHATIRGLVMRKGKKVPFQEALDLLDVHYDPPAMPDRILAWQSLLEEKKKASIINS